MKNSPHYNVRLFFYISYFCKLTLQNEKNPKHQLILRLGNPAIFLSNVNCFDSRMGPCFT